MDQVLGVITGMVMLAVLVFGCLHILGLVRGPSRPRRRLSRTERATFLAGAADTDPGGLGSDGGDLPSID